MKLNVKLLRKIKNHILAEPKRLRMDVWINNINDELCNVPQRDFPTCGTVACIAGWAHILNKSKYSTRGFIVQDVKVVLGLEEDLSYKLFYPNVWDEPFRYRYQTSKLPRTRTKITAEYIEYFIGKYG